MRKCSNLGGAGRGGGEHQALSPNGHFSTEAPEKAKMDDFLIKKVSKAWRTTFPRNLGV
jgi:hypothetical protein